MSVMKAIWEMRNESEAMRESGTFTDEEIDEFVDGFCEAHGFPKPAVMHVIEGTTAAMPTDVVSGGDTDSDTSGCVEGA